MLCLCVGLLLPLSARADGRVGSDTGYALPRFVSIDRDEAHLRAGPGEHYPIRAVLQWRNMPVKIIEEYGPWRKVELHDGSGGWLHSVLLDGARTLLIQGEAVVLRDDPAETADAVATFRPGVIAHLERCSESWCKVRHGAYEGWVPRGAGWGLLPGEALD